MKKKIFAAIAVLLVVVVLVASTVLSGLSVQKETHMYLYPIEVDDRTYNVALETNWTTEPLPTVSLINSSDPTRNGLTLYFLGGTKEPLTYNITILTDLLSGNISLVWKYYPQDPNRYILTNNGTHNSVQMNFEYNPPFSGSGYFEILGTQSAYKTSSLR